MPETSSHKLTPTEAVPLLEEALARGQALVQDKDLQNFVLTAWIKHLRLLFSTLESPSDLALSELEQAVRFEQRYHSMREAGEMPRIEAYRNDAFISALQVVLAQLAISRTKAKSAFAAAASKKAAFGNQVFIGHGQNSAWMELRQFIEKKLHLGVVEFNSVSTAGMTIVDRLKIMLDSVGFAFLIMTAEDHVGKSKEVIRARQNVIHEIGLFQGRLGFDKAIILLEQGCAQFSNVDGLIYISFPKGSIDAAFEKIRATLEAHGLVRPSAP